MVSEGKCTKGASVGSEDEFSGYIGKENRLKELINQFYKSAIESIEDLKGIRVGGWQMGSWLVGFN